MPYKNPEDKKENLRRYYHEHKDAFKAYRDKYKEKNKEYFMQYNKELKKDEEYRKTKLKIGSLIKIIKMAPSTKAITSGFKFHNEKYPNDIWENNNSFV